MSLRDGSTIFLLGAGASFDAQVPMSSTMLQKIEDLISVDDHWKKYEKLYYYVKHTIEYGNKIANNSRDFNIELLLVVLNALVEYRRSTLYPFILGYRQELLEYAGTNFDTVRDLIEAIQKELPKWVTLSSYDQANYFNKLEKFQSEYNYAIRIFTLNYDLCVERNISVGLETGFQNDNAPWDGSRFNKSDNEDELPFYLYKLHGSIDWERKQNILKQSQQQGITPDIIFGTDMKMQAVDPYLFYLYEFRRHAIEAKAIIVIGYSYNDGHINDLLKQAIQLDNNKKIISVSPCKDEDKDALSSTILKKLGLTSSNSGQVIIVNHTAKDFLQNILTVDFIEKQFADEPLPF